MRSCPDNCIRGVRKKDWIQEGVVSFLAFEPNYNTYSSRADQGYETSINWEDNDKVVEFTLSQETGKYGALVLPRKLIDAVNEKPRSKGCIKYERQKSKSNPYHGNVVFTDRQPKALVRLMAAHLAYDVIDIILPTDSD
jgi:hypothetical protein